MGIVTERERGDANAMTERGKRPNARARVKIRAP
ncbi:Uncharacterised protein [Mycobacteroides abscessus subsp. abscessus]|nr:Uncharacterised protein [Mycobacteroides abscessus subsp. abscessus]SIB15719.1 Uncharacterised protein [Mycobacteroides abscessus subsp. abscessus]SIN19459.1 Uncharacterised protein [Mycobacteroides abscessus subsp. abscessus]SKQ66142.1 Uncharacterised protein [Mycobacteroides abscessus subsp. abscessus]SKX40382.1 Uncharacterised protein [Mycobacteroides abscessus subsp. abscessus]